MAASKRYTTDKPGVFYRLSKRIGGNGEERVYYVVYKNNGKMVEVKAGRQYADRMTPAKASIYRNDLIEQRVKPRQVARKEEASKPTIRNLYEAYSTHRTFSTKAEAFNKYLMTHLTQFLDRTPDQLTTADLDKHRNKLLADGKSPQTAKHILAMLKRIINYGIKTSLCHDLGNLHFNMPQVNNQKTEYLSSEQIQRLLKALDHDRDQNMADLMRLALYTGIRHSALLALTWDDIDFERGFILLKGEHAKSGRTESVPMNEHARNVFKNLKANSTSTYLFPGRNGTHRTEAKRFFYRIKKAAELPKDFRPMHGLRHTFASLLASSGQIGIYELQKLLTHHSPQMTQRYAHLHDQALQRAANTANDIFNQIDCTAK